MPGSQDLIKIIDASLTKSEITETIAALQPLKSEIQAFAGIAIFTKNTQGAQEFREQATQLTAALGRIKQVEQELESLRAANSAKSRTRTAEEIAESQKLAEATRAKVRDIRSEEDAYKTLTNNARNAREEFQRLAAQYGINSKEAREAGEHSKKLSEHVQSIAKAGGDARTGIGRYTEGIKDFVKEAAGMFGAVVIIQEAFSFIKDSVKEFMAAEASTSRLKNILSNIGRSDVFKDLSKDAGELAEKLGTVSKKDVTETFQKLIIYGKLTKNQIEELTPVIANFAAQQGISMPEATDIFTKAMEGNAKALKTYGINIKEGKDASERYGIIMDQLAPKVAGATEAQGDLAVAAKKAEVATEELKVQIGEEFAPAIQKVWQAILEGVHGLPQMATAFKDFFVSIGKGAQEAWFTVKAVFGDTSDLAILKVQQAQNQKILEDSRILQNARESAEAFRKVAAKESLTDQQKHLKEQIAIARMDQEEYEMLKKKGQLQTENGKRATDNLVRSVAIIKALKEQFESSKDTRILGNGDPNDDGKKDKKDSGKDPVDYQNKIAIEIAKSIADESNQTTAARMKAYNQVVELQAKEKRNDEQKFHDDVENIGRLAKIQNDARTIDVDQANEDAKYFAKLDKDRLDAKTKAEKEAADANLKTWEAARKATQEADKKAAETKKIELKKTADLQKQAAEEMVKLGTTLAVAGFERQINALQKQIDKNNELKEVETKNIQSSTLSQQEKAAAQLNLDAKVAAQNEALARRQREMKQKEAVVERAAAVLQIAEQGAIAAVAALKIPIYGEAEAIAIGVITAAQIAAILAKPIPQYATGTENHPGGPMIVHPGEMRVDPDGKVSMTPNAPQTLTYGQRGTKIIPADEVNRMVLSDIMKMQVRMDKESKTDEYLQAILAATQNQTAAMKKKQPIHNHIHIHTGFDSHINNAVKN